MANFIGNTGNNTQAGTGGDDTFDYSQGGNDTLKGKLGDDTFLMGAALNAADRINGGASGTDTVVLDGDYNIVCGANTLVDIEALKFAAGHDYTITVNDAMAANTALLPFEVDAASLGKNDVLSFHGGAETAAAFDVHCGAANDTAITGAGADFLYGNGGNDQLSGGGARDALFGGGGGDTLDGGTGEDVLYGGNSGDTLIGNLDGDQLFGGAGSDTMSGGLGSDSLTGGSGRDVMTGGADRDAFLFGPSVSESTGKQCDRITDFDTAADFLHTGSGGPAAIDPMVASGTLNDATFNADLAGQIGALQLEAGHAVVFTPNAGDRAGAYLIVDANGLGGYQANEDLVIDMTGATGLENLSVGANFV